jgi:hypothetical protein
LVRKAYTEYFSAPTVESLEAVRILNVEIWKGYMRQTTWSKYKHMCKCLSMEKLGQ